MADNLGTSTKPIESYIKELISENRTSEEKIEQGKIKRQQREKDEKKSKVLEAIMNGLTRVETKNIAHIDTKMLNSLTNELIEERKNRKRIPRKKKKRSK